ncbi:hypothetical protein B0H10DRAFT_2332250 [Mycena sp. CBHHK59/15]|nr:hypothetical protein B0H10DRAFT_2332250 [Mycena sp. CBHHK59/15]
MTFTPTATKLQAYFEILVNNSTLLGERERERGGRINRAPTDVIDVNPRFSLATAHDAGLRSARANNGTTATETLPSWFAFFTLFVLQVQAVARRKLHRHRVVAYPKVVFESGPGYAHLVAQLLQQTTQFGPPYIPVGAPNVFTHLGHMVRLGRL